jgi:peptidoglycan/xylan/chitin deacetylase (PgdA/CDA1 family)
VRPDPALERALWWRGAAKPETAPRRLADLLRPQRYFARHAQGAAPVPIYFFHQVEPRAFERLCRAVVRRGLRTVTASELLDPATPSEGAIALTLDDGWSSAFSVAFPLARRHGIRLTLLVNPALVEDGDCRPGLDEGAHADELLARDQRPRARVTFAELRAMHASGLVEIQSHGLDHALVFAEERVVVPGFVGGSLPLAGDLPLLGRLNREDVLLRTLPAGTALRPLAPALASPSRFLDDAGRSESDAERRARLHHDLARSRAWLEAELPGARVEVLAPPFAAMHAELPGLAAEVGYRLILLGYPFGPPDPIAGSPIPVLPRLKADAVWLLLRPGPIGLAQALRARREATRAVSVGRMP